MDSTPLPDLLVPTPPAAETTTTNGPPPIASPPQRQSPSPLEPWAPVIGLTRWLYSNNPFYVLGALLLFVGLRLSHTSAVGPSFPPEQLLLVLAKITTLIALFTFALIRWGQVWDDVRSLLLLILLLIVGMSVTLDHVVAGELRQGAICTVLLWLYAIALVTGLLRGLKIRLTWRFELPLLLILSTIILFPLLLKGLLEARHKTLVNVLLAFYPMLGGLVMCSLLPAIRRGPQLVEHNGTPWRWPLFPWSMFAILASGLIGRAYYLCQSFTIGGRDDHFFGWYLLAPWCMALCVLALEETLRQKQRAAQQLILLVAFGAWMLASLRRETAFGLVFWRELHATLGITWLHLCTWLLLAFQAYALCRRASGAAYGVTLALMALAGVATDADWVFEHRFPWGIIAWGLFLLVRAIYWQHGLQAWIGISIATWGVILQFPQLRLERFDGLFVTHLMLLGAWLVLAWFRDRSTLVLHALHVVGLPLVAWHALRVHDQLASPFDTVLWYGHAPTLMIVALLMSLVCHPWAYRLSALVTCGLWGVIVGYDDWQRLRLIYRGLDHIVAGVVATLAAVWISIRKGLRNRAARIDTTLGECRV